MSLNDKDILRWEESTLLFALSTMTSGVMASVPDVSLPNPLPKRTLELNAVVQTPSL